MTKRKCPMCNGRGVIIRSMFMNPMPIFILCPKCKGKGYIEDELSIHEGK